MTHVILGFTPSNTLMGVGPGVTAVPFGSEASIAFAGDEATLMVSLCHDVFFG